MSSKTNKILIGVIIFMVGVFSLAQNVLGFQLRDITVAAAGLTLLLLYKTKAQSWSLVLGAYLTYIGLLGMLRAILPEAVGGRPIGAMFFIVPGIIFMTLFYDKQIKPLLIPASLLLWFGAFIILSGLPVLRSVPFGLFFMCIGSGFVMMHVLGKEFVGKFPMYFGVILCFAGLMFMTGLYPGLRMIRRIPAVGSVIMIGASIFIIINAIRKN